jgi:hypothetical protein
VITAGYQDQTHVTEERKEARVVEVNCYGLTRCTHPFVSHLLETLPALRDVLAPFYLLGVKRSPKVTPGLAIPIGIFVFLSESTTRALCIQGGQETNP